jgi:16S rRNA (guanine966-N2)-methyltransferase
MAELMRIMGGTHRGIWLKGPQKDMTDTRPILARIKKSIFDIMSNKLPRCMFLDLYAGTGSVGLEALSRGAQWVTFVENDKRCIRIITENVRRMKEEEHAEILKLDILSGLRFRGRQYAIIFMGPPYKDEMKVPLSLSGNTLQILARENLLTPDGWIVAQHHVKEVIPDIPGLERFRDEKYGDSAVSFFKRNIC